MINQYIHFRNLRFLLHEVLDAEGLTRFEKHAAYDREAIDMSLDAARQTGDLHLFPHYREMDKDKARFQDGEVWVHPTLRPAIKALADGGWIAATDDFAAGGQQMPWTVFNACLLIFYAANGNAASYAFLTRGAANLIRTFGDENLNRTFVPKMYAGDWQGTMALTEPQAGSSLSDITTAAEPQPDGSYRISGQKIYISGGDHRAVDNVIHLLLARIKGAPEGARGISLFAVPKLRPEGGELVANDVVTAGIFGKMGQKGYVAAHLMLGEKNDCKGYLVGQPHKGLAHMFLMMNEARVATGIMAIGTASAAYYAALKYANERPQGRHPSNKDVAQPQVLIIEHADVKRMLLFQKAVVEGSIALLLQCSYYADLATVGLPEEKLRAHLLLELLTPVAKSYPAEMGIQSVSTAMQCLGGAGYCDDFPIEQFYRDIRVNAIYEGTTGIHGMDLLGRKVLLEDGKAMTWLLEEIKAAIESARAIDDLRDMAEALENTVRQFHKTTMGLIRLAMEDKPEVFLADATLYLEYFGIVVIGWQWLKQAAIASGSLKDSTAEEEKAFYGGKLITARYFIEYELVKTKGLDERLNRRDRLTLDADPAFIN
ncbi:MAG TPA: acyl-CoA dehydrogenase [Flavilitoribacter sp.]|nr:acyl-CoA dehydrogenase [Flavilitoribacter sp.]HMQ86205.1 acyl-CoA dehydrogenase [Flavilitoribacter sp.]